MADKIQMPQLGESIAEGTIVKWLKRPGDAVRKDENVLVISTDKVEAEIPSPAAGVLLTIDVAEGKTVPVGTVLGYVGAAGDKVAAGVTAAPPTSAPPAGARAAARASAQSAATLPHDAFDVVIIGGGPGGYVAAARAGALGLKVALVEKDAKLGGTCLHRGCIPTKALLHAADVVTELKEASRAGVVAEGVRVDWAQLQKHKTQVISSNAGGIDHLMKARNVEVLKGFGRLEGAHTVAVALTDGGERKLATKNVVVAVGSKPRELPFAKFDGARVLSSDHATGALEKLPGSLCIIGGGVIGIEFASLFARLGTKVTVLELLPRILLPCDVEVAKLLHGELEKQGCVIACGVKVTEVGVKGAAVAVTYQEAGGAKVELNAEQLIVAVGRPPLTSGIGLESTAAKLDKGGFVEVNGSMESAEPGVFAIGDCVNTPWLAHVASAEGLIAVETVAHRLGKLESPPTALDYDHVPGCVYSEPPIAWCGLSEEEASKRGHDVKVTRYDFAKNAKAAILAKRRGFIKLVVDAKHGEILGAHIIGPQATDLIAEPAFAMQLETTVHDIATTVHAHPTLYEAIWEAASSAAGRAVHG
ncbi:MAG: dihydrolipoyl dehydrogenase [Deltaproteobacteria bacterium]|nr:dihydrolipoyl dehydrogenase [Deltaproteobacteria bacterium]